MPRFSVIVLANNVEDYLVRCLQSVVGQAQTDFEIIAIDNGSPDSCGSIIDSFAVSDHRVVALHLNASQDMGEARNAGMAQATGDYLLFLDGDDALTESSSLLSIARRLECSRPDVLIYDFFYKRHCELRRVSNLTRVLPGKHEETFRLRDIPATIRVSWSSCNKAYRRSFIEEKGLLFPSGYYEDSVWSCTCLLSAERISVLNKVCMNYTCCRRDSVSRKPSLRHLDVFEQYDRIFNFLDDNPHVEFPGIRAEITSIMSAFLRALGSSRKVIPHEVLDDFRQRAEEYIGCRTSGLGIGLPGRGHSASERVHHEI